MQRIYLLFLLLFAGVSIAVAQNGCPGCTVALPVPFPEDTIYIEKLPQGEKGKPYDYNLSFRLPKTTNPVHSVDSTTPPGLNISKFEIVGVDNFPPGLSWEANQTVFQTGTQTDGCLRICGTPTKADTFVMMVKMKATVLIFAQDVSFPLTLIVNPTVSANDGFSMTNFTGCGSTTVSFTNNVPSGGEDGFTYFWDFGDSTTTDVENPPAHTYTGTGIYPVQFKATVDTAGYILKSITVLSVECVDQLGVGSPDLFILVDDPAGTRIFDSQPDIPNTTLPYTFDIDLKMVESGNYKLQVMDEDSGIKGTDDLCGLVTFNHLSGDTIISGGFKAVLNIERPIEEILSVDTVIVYPQPIQPTLYTPTGTEACAGSDSLLLSSSYGAGNQWLLNGEIIAGENAFLYEPTVSGSYQVQVSNSFGCSAISAPVAVVFHPLPTIPFYINDRNRLKVFDATLFPAAYALQWYKFAAPIPGETGLTYCASSSGTYGLEITDLATGCLNFYSTAVTYDPAFDCSVGTDNAGFAGFAMFPNPTNDQVTLRFDYIRPIKEGAARLYDSTGRLLQSASITTNNEPIVLDCSTYPAGVYWVEIAIDEARKMEKLVVFK